VGTLRFAHPCMGLFLSSLFYVVARMFSHPLLFGPFLCST
jgi:hypothetical protein